jgi:hypothetical protein
MFREPSDSYILREAEEQADAFVEFDEAEMRYLKSDDYQEALAEFMFDYDPATGIETPTGKTEDDFRNSKEWQGYVYRFMERENEPDDYWRPTDD